MLQLELSYWKFWGGVDMKKKVSIILLVLLLVCSLTSCWFQDDLAYITETWVPEQDNNIAIISATEAKIFLNGENYFLSCSALEKYIYMPDIYYNYKVLCINGYNAFGVNEYQIDGKWHGDWVFYRINIQTNELEIMYSVDQSGNPQKNRPKAYVNNAVVYINDGVRTVTYDTNNDTLTELPNEDFGEPYNPYTGHCIAPGQAYSYEGDRETSIIIKRNEDGELRCISFDYIADRHEYFDQIREHWKDVIFKAHRTNPDDFFAYTRVYVLDNNIYLTIDVPDQDVETTCVVVRYDFETDKFHYLYHEYSSGDGMSKVVPVY